MKTFIEINLKNDTDTKKDVYTVVLDIDQLANVAKNSGLAGANAALDKFVSQFNDQFKERLSKFINR